MPEILEVETYRRQATRVVGRTIGVVDAPDAWFVKGAEPAEVVAAVTGRRVAGPGASASCWSSTSTTGPTRPAAAGGHDDGGVRLGPRFGMTGRLIVDGAASIDRLEYASSRDEAAWDRFALHFTDGTDLRLRDPGASAG